MTTDQTPGRLPGQPHPGRRTPYDPDVRERVTEAWHMLDRAHLALFQQSQRTGDPAIARFTERFEAASDAVLDLVMQELYPEPEQEKCA